MKLEGKVAVLTGGASGIGRSLAARFVAEGARAVVVADVQAALLDSVAVEIGATPVECDVTREADVQSLVSRAEAAHGPIDLFVSNAGIFREGGEETPDEAWRLSWEVHVMAHVYAARAVAPRMAARGEGYLLNTSSAAGLLTHVGSATYAVTKHAAIAFAEYLSIAYGTRGVKVSVLCPQAVRTPMTEGREKGVASVDGMMEPDALADAVIEGLAAESFLILPHPQVRTYLERKAGDYDRWLRGMRRLKADYDQGL